jgi:hypothetical protein
VLTWAEWRDWVHHARRGNPWFHHSGEAEVEIGPLVSPLRLDVTVRASYFEWFAGNRGLFVSDFEAFAAKAREHDYYVWFTRVMCPAWQPTVLKDERLLDQAWRTRLRDSAALYESFERDGFDTRYPITLISGRSVLPTKTGKVLERDLYAGDGNHRLALLMAAGRTRLLPSQYRVRRYRRLTPSDTTPVLLAALDLDEHRYLAFLRMGDSPHSSKEID